LALTKMMIPAACSTISQRPFVVGLVAAELRVGTIRNLVRKRIPSLVRKRIPSLVRKRIPSLVRKRIHVR
jgi:hypothetical protein